MIVFWSKDQIPDSLKPGAPVRCPTCGSTQIHAGRRGWNILYGVLGMNRVVQTCLKCDTKFSPRRHIKDSHAVVATKRARAAHH